MNNGKHPSGHGTSTVYVVEARTTYTDPEEVHGVLLTEKWRQIPTVSVESHRLLRADSITVPVASFTPHAYDNGWMDKEAAYSLAVQFQTDGRTFGGHLCVETRLVAIQVKWDYETEEVGVTEPFSLFGSLRYMKTTPRDGEPEKEEPMPEGQDQ